MRVLGIDPGTRYTGIGIIEAQAQSYRMIYETTLAVPKDLEMAQKVHWIYRRILEVITEYKPEVMAIEGFLYGKDLRAMMRVGQARSCAMLAASESGIDVVEYTPTRVKQAVSGNGHAAKDQVQHMVKTLLNLKALPQEDSADALAIAICHVHSSGGLRKVLATLGR
ncbi:MAG: crossover junction endodeoxyribonuclease RuvC [Candidatus Omnitrophota bacterium]|jgi:crossover junction endodeoxyribonuclease RuvC